MQFCFCHLYYDDLTDMPASGNRIREATVDDIRVQLLKFFGSVSTDLTMADLYNRGKGVFEMWEPLYGTDIYYDASVAAAGDDTYKVTTVFYNDPAKTERLGKTVLCAQLFHRRSGDLGEVGDAGAAAARRRRLVLADSHC